MIRVLVVDDSALMRKLISGILNSDKEIEVIDTAKNGQDALEKIGKLKPDVVTLDIRMPDMSGLDVLYEVMKKNPTPVIMFSGYSQMGTSEAIRAFDYGAVDVLAKPDRSVSSDLERVKDELIRLVKVAASVEISNLIIEKRKEVLKIPKVSKKLLVVGASTGGPPALEALLSNLPKDLPVPVLVVQHMPEGFTKSFSERLDSLCQIHVKEAEDGDRLLSGVAYVAKAGWHMEIKKVDKYFKIFLSKSPPVHWLRPAVDVTLKSAAQFFGDTMIAVILTGMGKDGVDGTRLVKENDGKVVVQDKATSLIFGMPKAVIDEGNADFILPLQKISGKVVDLL